MTPDPATPPRRSYVAIGIFTAGYLGVSTAAAIVKGNGEFGFYLGVMVVLITAVMLVNRRIRMPMAALWALTVWGLVHMAGGLVPVPASWPIPDEGQRVLYSLWLVPDLLKYDQLVHAYGFGVTTWVCWVALSRMWARGHGQGNGAGHGAALRPTLGPLFFAVGCGMGLGAMNELVEFAATKLLPGTNVGGYTNTGWDLVANLVGCLTAGVLIWFFGRSDLRADPL
ncbi:MAG: hypothetical protein IIC49_00535 [Planctomycetes bacterium]|nr:hypothetical protein [Planctomycetota bacterium]